MFLIKIMKLRKNEIKKKKKTEDVKIGIQFNKKTVKQIDDFRVVNRRKDGSIKSRSEIVRDFVIKGLSDSDER